MSNKKKKTKTNTKKKTKKEKTVFTKKSEAGKGDVPRQSIPMDEWEDRWEKIFGKKKRWFERK